MEFNALQMLQEKVLPTGETKGKRRLQVETKSQSENGSIGSKMLVFAEPDGGCSLSLLSDILKL